MTDYTQEYLHGRKTKRISYYNFKLRGVIIHMGSSDYGHYYSIIKQDDKWYIFNDSETKEFDIENLGNEAYGDENKAKSAYVLFYEREEYFDQRGVKMNYLSEIKTNRYNTNEFLTNVKNEIIDGEYSEFVTTLLSADEFYTFMDRLEKSIKNKNNYFKLFLRYFLVFVVRDNKKTHNYAYYKKLTEYLETDKNNCIFILNNFTNEEIFIEFLIECGIHEINLMVYGLLRQVITTLNYHFNELTESNKQIIKQFIDNLVLFIYNSIENSQFTVYGVYLLQDCVRNSDIASLIDIEIIEKLMQRYFLNKMDIRFNPTEEVVSEFLQKQVVRLYRSQSLRVINELIKLPEENFTNELITFLSVFYSYNETNVVFREIFTKVDYWQSGLTHIKEIRNSYKFADSLKRYAEADTLTVFKFIGGIDLKADNFKLAFIIFSELADLENEEIIFEIYNQLYRFLSSNYMMNYIIRDCTIFMFYYLSTLSRKFFEKVQKERTYIKLKSMNELAKDFRAYDRNNVG